jgi:hypothetical protein
MRWGRLTAVVAIALGAVGAAACGDAFSDASDGGGSDSSSASDGINDATGSDAGGDARVDGSAPDAPTDGGMPDGPSPPPCDAAAPLTAPMSVQCVMPGSPCTGGSVCCYSSTVDPTRCYTQGAVCNALRFSCDKQSDCEVSQICCLTGLTVFGPTCPYEVPSASDSHCAERDAGCVPGKEIELCTSAQTCLDPGKHCQPLEATVVTSAGTFDRTLGGCF